MGESIGKYRIVRTLGKGAMGEVFEVEHPALKTHFALKRFTLQKENSAIFRRRFAVEGKLLASLDHPNVIRIHDMQFDAETGDAYMVLDLVLDAEGNPRTLWELSQVELDEQKFCDWFVDLCLALNYIHERGIVHRDVKLNNVLVDETGSVRLSDFGIAKVLDDDLRSKVAASLTMIPEGKGSMQRILGTAAYLAPELESGGEVTAAADVYSLGVAFFRLLVGVWYDPYLVVNYEQLFGGFEYNWSEILPKLLALDPNERATDLTEVAARLRSRRARPRRGIPGWVLPVVAALSVAAAAVAVVTRGGDGGDRVAVVTNEVRVVTERVITNEVPVVTEHVVTNEVEVPVVRELVVTNEVPVVTERVVTNEVRVVTERVVTNEVKVVVKKVVTNSAPVRTPYWQWKPMPKPASIEDSMTGLPLEDVGEGLLSIVNGSEE